MAIEPFTINENEDGRIDVIFQREGSPMSFRNADSFRHVFRKRGLSDGELDLVLENHRYLRAGLSYCDEVEKQEFRTLAREVRKHPDVKSWPSFRDLIHLHPSVDPRRLVEDGGTKTHLVTLRREARRLLGEKQVQAIRTALMISRTPETTPMEVEPEPQPQEEIVAKPTEEKLNSRGRRIPERTPDKISKREDLAVIVGRKGMTNPGRAEKKETDKLQLYLTERYGLDKQDVSRMSGFKRGGPAYKASSGLPRQRLDLLKQNIKLIYKIDADADILHGENTRYHLNGSGGTKVERKREAAGMAPIVQPGNEPSIEELMQRGREHLRDAYTDFKKVQGKFKGMMALAMDDLLAKITVAIAECDGEVQERAS